MLRVGAIEGFKQAGRLLLLRMRFVSGRRVGQERERVKHICFHVRSVLRNESAHRAFVV